MSTIELIMFTLSSTAIITTYISLGLLIFIGKTRVKEIDIAVHGYEFRHDNFFALGMRVPNYSGGLTSKFLAKRGRLTGKIEHFDMKFKWPFIAFFIFSTSAFIFFLMAILMGKYYDLI